MKARYNSSVKTPAGWRGVEIVATVEKISDKRVKVLVVDLIDNEIPNFNQSRTGAKHQQFNGRSFAQTEEGKTKNISALLSLE